MCASEAAQLGKPELRFHPPLCRRGQKIVHARKKPGHDDGNIGAQEADQGSAVRIPAGPALTLIDPAGLSSLPSKLNARISFSTMHWTRSKRLPLLQARP